MKSKPGQSPEAEHDAQLGLMGVLWPHSDRETGVGKTDPGKGRRRPWASCLPAPTLRPT